VITSTLFLRLDARDRALLTRCAIDGSASRAVRLFWLTVTHLGGAFCAVTLAVLPFLVGGLSERAGVDAAMTLVVSHLLVQVVKRTVGRPRPMLGASYATLIKAPDRFSFPSGHSAAAMSVAFAYAAAYPHFAAPVLLVAMAVGLSRVALGVHYPGDVFVGQLMAVLTGAVIVAI
jgi:undecaprenyl-diphosphatase